MPTVEQCAYAAGFMDGEGSIYIRGPHGKPPHTSSYSICVNIANDDIRPMRFIQEVWGGSLNPGPIRPNGKCSTRWTVTAAKAAAFLNDALPFLKGKKEQAQLAIEMQGMKRKVGPWQPLDEHVVEQWAGIKAKVSALNGKYPGYYEQIGVN